MPSPYTPPVTRRAQAVKSARGRFRQRLQAVQSAPGRLQQRWRGWWLVPLLGLLPIVVAVVLASEGRFGPPNGQPVATGAAGTSSAVGSRPAGVTQQPQGAPATPAGQTANPATGEQPGAARPTTTDTSAQTGTAVSAVPGQAAPRTTVGTSAGQAPGAGATASQVTGAAATANQGTGAAPAATVQGGTTAAATGPFRAYAVKPGDTVKFVAQLYGVSPASISQASGLQNPDHLRIGQVLTIPDQPGWLYRVQPGETLDQIAARSGTSTEIILSASKLATDNVRAGDVILIPDQAVALGK